MIRSEDPCPEVTGQVGIGRYGYDVGQSASCPLAAALAVEVKCWTVHGRSKPIGMAGTRRQLTPALNEIGKS